MVRIFCLCLIVVVLVLSAASFAQRPRSDQKRNTRPAETASAEPSPDPSPEAEQTDVETVKINTDLVIVPVVATDMNGLYVSDIARDEFSLEEDGIKQEVAFFATVSTPFQVVLLLDTSASTQEKLISIQNAAVAFTEQLKSGDRVKVISFDDEVRDLNEFTSDRQLLKTAIDKARPGEGTKLYDALELALATIRNISGRKAIVLFSDGVDWHSDHASLESTLRGLDEEGVIVYPIRYDTRAETERLARQQAEEITPELPTMDVIRRAPDGTTAPTFPSDEPDTVPTTGTRQKTGPLGLPLPAEILRRRRESDPDRMPSPDGLPPSGRPTHDPAPDSNPPSGREGENPDRGRYPGRRTTATRDSISTMLDSLYSTADGYLKALAEKSGGRVLRADSLKLLPNAFAQIAAELRTQYSLGYYPSNKARDDRYRRIKVSTSRKDAVIRTRPGYHVPSGNR